MAGKLRHPCIVSVFDVQIENGQPFIVQEYIDGLNLGKIIELEGPLPPDAALRVTTDVAEALAHAHAEGIQHLDVKPGNILIARSGRALVYDQVCLKCMDKRIENRYQSASDLLQTLQSLSLRERHRPQCENSESSTLRRPQCKFDQLPQFPSDGKNLNDQSGR
jgi:tRNA A-37 threonylcarbamoyl transferase component Bud32